MVPVVQVDRDLVPAKRRCGYRQVVMEPHDCRFAIFLQARWSWILAIEAPYVGRREIRVERMEAGSGFQLVSKVCRGELGPAWVRRSVGFAGSEVRKFSWLRV